MKVIYKYPWFEGHIKQLQVPEGAELLAVQTQNNTIEMWFLHDDDAGNFVLRTFTMRTTGNPFVKPENEKYVETIQLNEGSFVGHIFELT